jgi:hypothetical protein
MARLAVFWIKSTNCSSDPESPVSSLSNILIVPEREHQFVARFSVLSECKPPFLWTLGKPVVGEGRGDNVESRATGFGQEVENGESFDETSWPFLNVSHAVVLQYVESLRGNPLKS